MSFDQPTRNALARMVGQARQLLAEDVGSQLLRLGFQPGGATLDIDRIAGLSEAERAAGLELRTLLEHFVSGESGSEKARREAAHQRLVREIGFTTLNRLVALRMAEERGLVVPSVGAGLDSAGFRVYDRLARGALGSRVETYRAYLESLYDELALDLPVLFDRFAPESLVFPGERCLEAVLKLLNDPSLASIWKEDEAIGWVYQYYNDPAERKKMRDASQAPRNSREMAVRNQFFTPRYVVEFLTDNTLGRTWYEMRRGQTRLADQCRYMVKRKHPIFLAPDEQPPEPFPTGQEWRMPDGEGVMWTRPNPALGEYVRVRDDVWKYSLTINGYVYAETHFGVECADIWNRLERRHRETGKWEGSFEELRCTLFVYQRGWYDSNTGPPIDDFDAIRDLYDAICRQWDLEVEYVPYRAPKDPREIRVLDPACGSGHFLLYAFDLLETIYEEAWEDESSRLRHDYPDLDALRRALSGLILRHNLHGIDIDPRACQIAGLALWLHAQRGYQQLKLRPADRPPITRSNVVCAEPMPGEKELLEEYLKDVDWRLRPLVRAIWEKMRLAGEAGSLLKIEEEIAGELDKARTRNLAGDRVQLTIFEGEQPARQLSLGLQAIEEERAFWERAEAELLDALRGYARHASNGQATRRRLFADDAEQGFAFVDLCRKRFDVVLMNPPFGEPPVGLETWARDEYPNTYYDLLAAFLTRAHSLASGTVGAIVSEACLYGKYLSDWRKSTLLPRLRWLIDLGDGVLDSALVKTVALVSQEAPGSCIEAWDVAESVDKAAAIEQSIDGHRSGTRTAFRHDRAAFLTFPHASLLFKVPADLRGLFSAHRVLQDGVAKARSGLTTYGDDRFLRLLWEVPVKTLGRDRKWVPIFKGGNGETFHADIHLVVLWENEGREMGGHNEQLYGTDAQSRRASRYYFREAVCYARRAGKWFAAKPLWATTVFGDTGPAVIPEADVPPLALLAYLNSDPIRYLMHAQAQGGGTRTLHLETGLVDALPWPDFNDSDLRSLEELGEQASKLRLLQSSIVETEPSFSVSQFLGVSDLHAGRRDLVRLVDDADLAIQDVVCLASDKVATSLGLGTDARQYFPPRDQHRSQSAVALADRKEFARALVSVWFGLAVGRPFREWSDHTMSAQYPLVGVYSPSDDYQARGEGTPLIVDDPEHPADLVQLLSERSLHQGIDISEVEAELGQSIRSWLRGGFFEWHRQRYSRSRRQAPIYWPLSTASGSYTLWVYYHRLSANTLFTAINRYLEPKIEQIQRRASDLEARLRDATGREASRLREQHESDTTLLAELRELRTELLRVLALPYQPDLNDGVIINAAPLHRLFRLPKWAKDTRECWAKLEAGEYDWAHLAYTLWPERVRERCRTDRSLAIAHGLEKLYVEPPVTGGKRGRRRQPTPSEAAEEDEGADE